MCGIAGILTDKSFNTDWYNKTLTNFGNQLKYRGPDSDGIWFDALNGIGISHRRLSIIELSNLGHQPMYSKKFNTVLSYNGEIYNHKKLRKMLDREVSIDWLSTSDTETLLECLNNWGVDKTLSLIDGMFAFAYWDRKNKNLILARDSFGEKPLYFGWLENSFLFASELGAFKNFDTFDDTINKEALDNLFRFSYIPSPLTIFNNFFKLENGFYLKINKLSKIKKINIKKNNEINNKSFILKKWSDFKNKYENSINFPIENYETAKKKIKSNLFDSIESRMLSDVEVGSLLSGGIDSSLVTAIMSKVAKGKIKTFNMGFENKKFDESQTSLEISNYLNTDHNKYIITEKELINTSMELCNIYNEPFADSSQIPTYQLTKNVSKKVKVALSGDGGDELFGGYNRYIWGRKLWNKLRLLNKSQKKIIVKSINITPKFFLDLLQVFGNNLLNLNVENLSDKLYKISNKINWINNIDELYLSLVNEISPNDTFLKNYDLKNSILEEIEIPDVIKNNLEEKMMFLDTLTYLPDDILCKVDRASMSNSLEVRVPFLTENMIDLSNRIPLEMKIQKNINKKILRDVAYEFIPKKILNKPKKGFGIPLANWLKDGPLHNWSKNLINEKLKLIEDIVDRDKIKNMWQEHLSGKRDWHTQLWPIIIFISWYTSEK